MALCEFRSLEAIFLDENELMGNLPACLALLRELKQLYVFKNQLNGDIPNELSILLKLGTFLLFPYAKATTSYGVP